MVTTTDGKIAVKVPLNSRTSKIKRPQRSGHLKAPLMKDTPRKTAQLPTAGYSKTNQTKSTTNRRAINTPKPSSITTKRKPIRPLKQKDGATHSTTINAGNVQLLLTPKMKTFEHRFEQAINFKFNAKDTNQEERQEGNAIWLRRAGYTEEEITDHLLDTFKRVFCRRFKSAADALKISEEDQPWNHFWVRKVALTADMKGVLSRWLKFIESLEKNKNAYFERIGVTSLKQRKLDRLAKRAPGHKIIQELHDESNKFFQQAGLFEELKADPDKTIIHALFTDHDSNINFQQPHTDFDYLPSRKPSETGFNYSWTAHMPITKEGSWITLWFGVGKGYTVKIPFGTILLLRSDVIHGGGTPIIERNTKRKWFRRLHYYLVTEDQPAVPGFINPFSYDGKHLLSDLHVQIARADS
jgi:hypothetical protein